MVAYNRKIVKLSLITIETPRGRRNGREISICSIGVGFPASRQPGRGARQSSQPIYQIISSVLKLFHLKHEKQKLRKLESSEDEMATFFVRHLSRLSDTRPGIISNATV